MPTKLPRMIVTLSPGLDRKIRGLAKNGRSLNSVIETLLLKGLIAAGRMQIPTKEDIFRVAGMNKVIDTQKEEFELESGK